MFVKFAFMSEKFQISQLSERFDSKPVFQVFDGLLHSIGTRQCDKLNCKEKANGRTSF